MPTGWHVVASGQKPQVLQSIVPLLRIPHTSMRSVSLFKICWKVGLPRYGEKVRAEPATQVSQHRAVPLDVTPQCMRSPTEICWKIVLGVRICAELASPQHAVSRWCAHRRYDCGAR